MPKLPRFPARVIGLAPLVIGVVSTPFIIFGDAYVVVLLESLTGHNILLLLLAIALLVADAVAPVPATLVIMFFAVKAGWIAGMIGGTVGLSGGVLAAVWVGRTALGPVVPRFLPAAELARLRESLQRNLPLTLACWRSVPVLAEASVMLAAAAGIPRGAFSECACCPTLRLPQFIR